jgi:hypothetical protein
MRQSIPAGLTKEHVLLALADLDAGLPHPFGEPTKYELVYGGEAVRPQGAPRPGPRGDRSRPRAAAGAGLNVFPVLRHGGTPRRDEGLGPEPWFPG